MHVTLVDEGGCLKIVAADFVVGAKPMLLTGLWGQVGLCPKNMPFLCFFDPFYGPEARNSHMYSFLAIGGCGGS